MIYTYDDLCAWRKEAAVELKKGKAKLGKTKSLSGKLGNVQKGLTFGATAVKSGMLERIIERIRK